MPQPPPEAKGNGNECPTCLSFELVTRFGADKKLSYSHYILMQIKLSET